MKTSYSEQYYRNQQDKFLSDRNCYHFDEWLEHEMSIFKELPKEAIDLLIPVKAKEIVEKATSELKQKMLEVKAVQSGKASLGYTSAYQETRERARMIQMFEFNCLQLSDFKKKYNI